MNEQEDNIQDYPNETNLSSDVQNFLKSIEQKAAIRNQQDESFEQDLLEDNADTKYDTEGFDEEDTDDDVIGVSNNINISEDDSNFSEEDLEELF